jgi:hypothetical protein
MATAKFVTTITNHVSSGTMSGASLSKLVDLKNAAQASCMAETKFLTDALKAYKQLTHLLNATSCTVHLSTFDFAGRVAMGDFLNDTLMEEFGTNPDKALSGAVNLINSACSSINGIMGMINMLKDFLLALYRLMDFLKGLGDFGIECHFGELELLLGQTNKPTPGVFSFPVSIQTHFDNSARILSKMYGNASSGVPSALSYSEAQLSRDPVLAIDSVSGIEITSAMILQNSLVNPNSLVYDPDISFMYDKGLRFGQALVDMQSRVANGLIMDAGDIATAELMSIGTCSIDGYSDKTSCETAGGVWTVISTLAKTTAKIPRTLQISAMSELFDTTVESKDNVLNTSTGITYIRSYETLPLTIDLMSVQGVAGSVPPYHYTLSIQSKNADSSYISLQSIPGLEQKLVTVTSDYNSSLLKLLNAKNSLADAITKASDVGTPPSVLSTYTSLMNSYDSKSGNITDKYNIVNNNPNKIGQLKWLIDLGNQAITNGVDHATLNNGTTGLVTLTFPIKSFDTTPGAFNDITNSNEFISTDITNVNSYLNQIQQFYNESNVLDNFITDLSSKTRDLILVYNDFQSKNALSDQIYYGVHKPYVFPGKGTIRTGDAKVYVSFSKPHTEILNDIPDNITLNLFHGDVFYDNTNDNGITVKMYLRVLGSVPNYYNYKWVDIGSTVSIDKDISGTPIPITITIDPTVFASIDSKTNIYTSGDGIDPSLNWSVYKSWINIGDVWLDSSNITIGLLQKVYIYDSGLESFKWTALLSNNAPALVPNNITTLEDSIITGNLLSSAFDMENDVITLVSVTVAGVETNAINGSNVNVTISNSLGIFTLISDTGDYIFTPTANKNTNTTFSFTYKAKDSKGAVSTSIFSIAITPVNDPPQVSGPIDVIYLTSQVATTIDLLSNTTDIDLDIISIDDLGKVSGNDSNFVNYNKYTRVLEFNPTYFVDILKRDEINNVLLTYSVTDNKSAKVPTSASIKFKGINHPPIISGPISKLFLVTDAVSDVHLDQNATDFDGDILRVDSVGFTVTGDEVGITRVLSSNKVTVNPSLYSSLKRDQTSVVTYSYHLLDAINAQSSGTTATITIKGINHPPIVSNDIIVNKITTDASFDIMLDQNATDFDGDILSIDPLDFNATGNENGITRVLASNKVTVTPQQYHNILKRDETLDIVYTYYVLDSVSVRSNMATTKVTLKGVNHPPVISGNITVNKLTSDTTFDIMLDQFATDFDGDILSVDPLDFNATGNETGITRVLSSNKVTVNPSLYTLATGVHSVITYTYYVLDEVSARSNLATLTITITGA